MDEPTTAIGIHLAGKLMRRAQVVRSGAKACVVSLQTARLEDPTPVAPVDRGSVSDETRTIAALPGLDAMTRCWIVPDSDRAKLRQVVANRLEAESPIPLEELSWSYRAGAGLNGSGMRPVLVQAARNSRISRHLASLQALGCRPDVLTTEAEAVAALCRHAVSPRTAATATGLELLVLADEVEWMVCLVGGGLVHCVRRIRVDAGQLELACRQVSSLVETESDPQAHLQRIRWCGKALGMDVLSASLGIVAEEIDAARDLLKLDGSPLSPAELVEYGPAIGLALAGLFDDRDVIALLMDQREQRQASPLDSILAHPWRWAAAAAMLFIAAIVVHVSVLRHETRLMGEANQHGTSPMAELDPKVRAMQRLERYRIDVEGTMAELARTIPPSIIAQSVQIARERRLVIKGTSGDPKAIYTWVEALRKSSRFAAVNPERTAPGQGGDFTITAELNGVQKLTTVSGRGGSWR